MRSLLIASIACALLPGAAGAQASAGAPEVVASGRGEMRVAPATATVVISVTTRASTAAAAAGANASKLATTISAIRAAGVAASDIVTMGYNVGQNWEFTSGGRQPSGFIARNSVRLEVRKLDDLGRIIDAALAGGASEVSSVQFGAPTTAEARRSALASAVREARADAEAMATAAGGRLGRIISITTGDNFALQRDYAMREVAMAGGNAPSPTNISPRDLTILATVTGRWELVPGNR